MQLTKFDRWLKEKFAIETHVQVLRLPDDMPHGVKVVELPDIAGQRFKFLLVCEKTVVADQLFKVLRDAGMMFNTQIVVRDNWYVRFIAPQERSVTWTIISWIIITAIILMVAYGAIKLLQDPEIRENLKEALEILKG